MKPFQPDKSNRQHPFVAPEGYFDELPPQVQRRVNEVPAMNLPSRLLPRWAYVAVGIVTMTAVSTWLAVRPMAPATNPVVASLAEQLLAEVPIETLVDYLLLAEVDVMSAASLSEAEQEELLEQLDAYDDGDEPFFDDTSNEDS